jgi:hypothetical protein
MTDLDDFSRYARIIPEEHQPALRKCLKKIPDFSWLLSEPHSDSGKASRRSASRVSHGLPGRHSCAAIRKVYGDDSQQYV